MVIVAALLSSSRCWEVSVEEFLGEPTQFFFIKIKSNKSNKTGEGLYVKTRSSGDDTGAILNAILFQKVFTEC